MIIVECKADAKRHESKGRDRPRDYAVDGVLHYSGHLAREFNVLSVAVSGQSRASLKISTFLQLKGREAGRLGISEILEFASYEDILKHGPVDAKSNVGDLMRYSKELHVHLRECVKISETEKPLLVSGILIALTNDSFKASYRKCGSPRSLARALLSTIREVLISGKLDENKREAMLHPYQFIKMHAELLKERDAEGKPARLLLDLIHSVESNVLPFMTRHAQFDVLGQFYGEFLRYTDGDKKGLGIVLTPKHITELFVELADVRQDDVVVDNCCGTGGFLISAMDRMLGAASSGSARRKIKESQLVGIEQQPNMFALACANMILRGDGKANIYHKDCFEMADAVRQRHGPTIGLLNPPYSQKGEGLHELDFVLNCLDTVGKNGRVVAIVPITCATMPTEQKRRMMERHTLEAVMSMPNELFKGVVTCVMVFTAKVPHDPGRETWFGYWKDDGFVKTKHMGRVDRDGRWGSIMRLWVGAFRNRREAMGESVLRSVTAEDEWVAEAYMETDYSKISEGDFVAELKKYAAFRCVNSED